MMNPQSLLRDGTLYLQGDFTFHSVQQIWLQLKMKLKEMPRANIDIDLIEVQRVDSACLALFLALTRLAKQQGKSLHFKNIPDKMRALAKVSGVQALLC